MNAEDVKNALIDLEGSNEISNSIPSAPIKHILWYGFNGSEKSYSWATEWSDYPLYRGFKDKRPLIINLAIRKVLKIQHIEFAPISVASIESAKVGTALVGRKNELSFWNVPRWLRNAFAHAMFCKTKDASAVLFNHERHGSGRITFGLKIKRENLSRILNKWSSFSSGLLQKSNQAEVAAFCFDNLGFKDYVISDSYIRMESQIGGSSYLCIFPCEIQERGDYAHRKAISKEAKAKYPGRILVVFLHQRVESDSNRDYLFIEEFLEYANKKRIPNGITEVLKRGR